MSDRWPISAGAMGATLAAICCTTLLLAVIMGDPGLTAWLVNAEYVLLPALLMSVAVLGLGFYRRRASASCRDSTVKEKVQRDG